MGEEKFMPSTLQQPVSDEAVKQIGFAVVGIGELTESQLLPAFEHCKHAKPVALVGEDKRKMTEIAARYNISNNAIYDYDDFDLIANNHNVDVVYIVLPNALHKEFTLRAAAAGKHVLCEKPMATSSADAKEMIDVCRQHHVKLMVAYRIQYEPHHKVIKQWVKDNVFGKVKIIDCFNAEQIDDPTQWRFDKDLAGGGVLMDLGIYCVNTMRYLTDEEPIWVSANTYSTPGDERFKEVEETILFQMGFPGGIVVTCGASYGVFGNQCYRCYTEKDAWFGMEPAFAYTDLKIQVSTAKQEDKFPVPDVISEDQFSLVINHMASCILKDKEPDTPGEEGYKDQLIMEAIYLSAELKRRIDL